MNTINKQQKNQVLDRIKKAVLTHHFNVSGVDYERLDRRTGEPSRDTYCQGTPKRLRMGSKNSFGTQKQPHRLLP